MENVFRYWNKTIQTILNADSIVIYGAGTMGKALRKCLTESPYNLQIECFIVRSMADNAEIVDGLQVYDIPSAGRYKSSLILLAMNGKYIPEATKDLRDAGFHNLIPISFDGDEWTYIRGNWSMANGLLAGKATYLSNDLKEKLHLYVVHSIYDRELSHRIPEEEYEIPIQVGAELTDKVMYPVRDSVGEDNISHKNRQYCELTGIYWVWRNDFADYIGFSHYRRRFRLTNSQIEKITAGGIDVVVTEPIVNFDGVKQQYSKDHHAADWHIFMQAICELEPEYARAAEVIQNGTFYYAYNMFIMKREVLHKYCEFMFPILEYCERKIGQREDVYQNRYVGFLAERLLSIFLEKNSEYRVAIADKTFIE